MAEPLNPPLVAGAPLYALLIGLRDDALLLPNAALAEVVTADQLRPIIAGGGGHVGDLRWQNRDVPVLSFEALNGAEPPALDQRRSRLVVLHALSRRMPGGVFAVLAEGYPQLVPLNPAALRAVPLRPTDREEFVLSRVRIAMREAAIPDLERVEAELSAALTVRL